MILWAILRSWHKVGLDALTHDSTRPLEIVAGFASMLRGLQALLHPSTAFPPEISAALTEILPITFWGMVGLIPGGLQILAVGIDNLWLRRVVSFSNVGLLLFIVFVSWTHRPDAMVSMTYVSIWLTQIYISARVTWGTRPVKEPS